MATEAYKITGKAFFPKLFEQNKDTKFDEGGNYQVTLIVDDKMADLWDTTGAATKVKFDRGTKENKLTFRRKHVNKFEWAGGPPTVLNPDGSVRKYEDGVIWNDSLLECEVHVYDTKMGKGTRLHQVKILELAPEPADEDGPPTASAPKATPPKAKAVINDDVPF